MTIYMKEYIIIVIIINIISTKLNFSEINKIFC